jgi:hypothetical protein
MYTPFCVNVASIILLRKLQEATDLEKWTRLKIHYPEVMAIFIIGTLTITECHETKSNYGHIGWSSVKSYLTVQPQEDDHEEEEDGPQWGQGHLSHSLGVGYERQSWTYKIIAISVETEIGNKNTKWLIHRILLQPRCE